MVQYAQAYGRTDLNEKTREFARVKKFVETWHFRSHVGAFCREHCNPNSHPEIKDFNTLVCEQHFKWVAGFKHMTRVHMSAAVFNFFLLLLCWLDHEQYNSPYRTEA
uniref:Uncharacterized protein n=1 Tax=Pyramimonas obovata TaxID=1411642 RepID=A0A7S0WRA5_9CHLO